MGEDSPSVLSVFMWDITASEQKQTALNDA